MEIALLLTSLSICVLLPSVNTIAIKESTSGEHDDVLARVKRVIGGEVVEEGDWPYLVRLRGKVPAQTLWSIPISYNNYYCGGSVINERWIVTAAHCAKQLKYPDSVQNPKYWHAKVGKVQAHDNVYDGMLHFVGRMMGIESLQTWNVHTAKIIIHPGYSETDSWMHDIALFKLDERLPIHSHSLIGAVPLPHPNLGPAWPRDGDICVMKGWGCSERGGFIEDVARQVEMPKVSDAECNRVYVVSSETRLCAGHSFNNKGICSGDSGGPLVCRYAGNWTLAGVASFTSANAPESFPGVFTRVSQYIDWIEDVIIEDFYGEHYQTENGSAETREPW